MRFLGLRQADFHFDFPESCFDLSFYLHSHFCEGIGLFCSGYDNHHRLFDNDHRVDIFVLSDLFGPDNLRVLCDLCNLFGLFDRDDDSGGVDVGVGRGIDADVDVGGGGIFRDFFGHRRLLVSIKLFIFKNCQVFFSYFFTVRNLPAQSRNSLNSL